MRSRTASGIQHRLKSLLSQILNEFEYTEKMAKEKAKKKAKENSSLKLANNTMNEGTSKQRKSEKRKSWTPVVRFTLPDEDVSMDKENLPVASTSKQITKQNTLSAKDVIEID